MFSPFEEVLQLLDEYNIILTPQNCVPIDDGNGPSDIHILGTGIFNLGFIALSQAVKIESFLNWWTERLVKYGFADERNNMFFDQVWINFVPVFFDSYYILKHPGYNMAPSNLHERQITEDLNQSCTVNNQFPLRFYHYSGYTFSAPSQICSYSQRYTFEGRPELRPLYNSYRRNLHKNNIINLSRIEPAYCIKKIIKDKTENKIRKSLNRLSRAIRVLAGKN